MSYCLHICLYLCPSGWLVIRFSREVSSHVLCLNKSRFNKSINCISSNFLETLMLNKQSYKIIPWLKFRDEKSGVGKKNPDPGLCTSNEGWSLKVYKTNMFGNFKSLLFWFSYFHTFNRLLKISLNLRFRAPDPVFGQKRILIPSKIEELSCVLRVFFTGYHVHSV